MLGVSIVGPSIVFYDKECMYKNDVNTESQVKRKYNSIYFYRAYACVASGILIPHKVDIEASALVFHLSGVNERKYTSSCTSIREK